jgi:hypothetical protein
MKKYKFQFLCILFIGQLSYGQELPIIKANSKVVDILDGNDFQKGNWNVSPEVKPDIFNVSRFRRTKKVAFYTDIDSISFIVEPQKEYKFIILLNGKDTAYTTISTFSTSQIIVKSIRGTQNVDTIPFTLGKGNKIYIKGKINNSEELDFMFDTGSDQEVISKNGLSKGVKINFSDTKNSVSIGGTTTINNSKSNQLEIGNLVWKNIPFVQIDGADADGIIGYNAFDNKIVEIDYDKKVLVIHNNPFEVNENYQKLPIIFKGNLPFIEATLSNSNKQVKGYFEFDAGSNGSLWINKDFAKDNSLYNTMKTVGESSSRGFDGKKIYNETVLLPKFSFGKYDLLNVPIDLEQPSESNNFKWGILGMDILRRYNVILDFQNDLIYLKPNSLLNEPFNKPFNKMILWIGISLLVVLLLLGRVAFYRKRKARLS